VHELKIIYIMFLCNVYKRPFISATFLLLTFFKLYFNVLTSMVKGVKGEKGDMGRGSANGVGGLDTSGFPAGFVEGPQGPPGRKVS